MFSIDSLPKKRMAVGALIRNMRGEILIVKPTYRPEWLVPGGCIEEDESPFAGCVREVQEETGLKTSLMRLLVVEYCSRGVKDNESIQFSFDGGVLSDEQITQIKLPADELSEFRFVSLEEAMNLLAPKLAKRIRLSMIALNEHCVIYAEDGVEVGIVKTEAR